MKIYKIVELSQGSDYHGAYHHVDERVRALCVSILAAEEHIEELLRLDHQRRLRYWTEGGETYDKPELETNSVWLTEEFNGADAKEHHRFIIEESELIEENYRGA